MKKNVLLYLRFVLILTTILVITYSKRGLSLFEPGYAIALLYFFSNVFLYYVSKRIFMKSLVQFCIFLFDVLILSAVIYYVQGLAADFYLIYFLVILVASLSQNIAGSIPIAIVASIMYGWLTYQSNPGMSFFDPAILIRIPFLIIIALISSYWSQSTRRASQEKEELERFNRELKKEVDRVATEEIELRQYSEKIINNVPSGVIAVRHDGLITTLNREAERVFGLKGDETLGCSIQEIAGLHALWQKMEQSIMSNTPVTRVEISIRNKHNEVIPIGLSISPITGPRDRFSGCVTIFKDLSELKALEEKLRHAERLSYLGKMASWVAHEIRNPLTSIDGFAQLLENTEEKEKIKLFSSEIQKGTKRITYIIDDILAFARTKRQEKKLTDINLKSLIESIVAEMNIDTQIASDNSPIVRGEIESIRRLFVNLIDNSIEAMNEKGKLRIRFSANKHYWITEIVDNGVGISKDNMKNLFTPFFTTKERGTGLGLAIVKKIVDEYKGKIKITSEVDKGTTCRVYLLKKSDQKGSK
ncbi:MAG: PAS domain S-box protein [candidate division WOR-3 bacterium]|nr:MAG: PAS domain S-box protein [candidate division WOR-3 bacterium]